MKVPTRITPSVDESARPLQGLSISGASPDAFGAQIGAGLQNLGQGGLRVALAFGKNSEEEQAKDFATQKELIRHTGEFTIQQDEIKRGATPNGLGTRKQLLEAFDKRFSEDFMKNVPLNKRPEYEVKLQTLRSKLDVDGYEFERNANEAFSTAGVEDEVNRAKVGVERAPDNFNEYRNGAFELIDKGPWTPAQKLAKKRDVDAKLQEIHFMTMNRINQKSSLTADPAGAVDVFMKNMPAAESSGNPSAQNPRSSAGGLSQFIDSTWADMVQKYRPDIWSGLPGQTKQEKSAAASLIKEDKKLSLELGRAYAMENATKLRDNGFSATPGNLYLSHFLGPNGALNVLSARPTADIRGVVGKEAYEKNLSVFEKAKTPEELIEWAKGKMSGDASPMRELPKVEAIRGTDGYWRAPNIEYDLAGKTRAEPVAKEYAEKLGSVLKAIQPGLGAVITSAGQHEGEGTGSHRHDVDHTGHAGTSDFVLTIGGKKILPGENKELYAKAIEQLAAQGFTGIGHYKWGLHVGGGSRAFWGPNKTGATADPMFKLAAERGWAKAGDYKRDALDTDSRYASIPYERRIALRADSLRLATADSNEIFKEEQARKAAWRNDFFVGLNDGKIGQAGLDDARAKGFISDAEEIAKAQKIIDSKKVETTLEQQALAKYQNPVAVWDSANKEDRDGANALVGGEKGKARLGETDQAYVSQVVLPFIQRARIVPTDVTSTLTAMLQSQNPKQAWFALDALSQIERANPQAYAAQVPTEVQNSVDRWIAQKDHVGQEDVLRSIRGGNSPEERKSRLERRKEGETFLAEKKSKIPQIETIVNDIVKDAGSLFQRVSPDAQMPFAMHALERQVQSLWLSAYESGLTEEQSTKVATDAVKRRWGVSAVTGINQFMELPPPKAGYQPLFGSYSWINDQIRNELKLTPDQGVELLTDEQTKDEFKRWQANPKAPLPSYRLFKVENGVKTPVYDAKNLPLRMNFEPTVEDRAKDADYTQARSTQVGDEAFFKEYELMLLHSRITNTPIPRDILEEYELRKGRAGELETTIRRNDPTPEMKPLMEFGPGGISP